MNKNITTGLKMCGLDLKKLSHNQNNVKKMKMHLIKWPHLHVCDKPLHTQNFYPNHKISKVRFIPLG